ncbi:MAG: beta-lactamase family protein [Lentisphaeria bacterium]|nr:beta-lactamase family protein [Lentisphaeria bacterium]
MDIAVDKLQAVLDESVASGEECGVQLTIYQDGELAAELCSGYTDSTRTVKVTEQSLFPLFSSGKAVMATAFHILKEERGFDYSEKVSDYWKEFTGNGKETLEIRHILSHRSGLHINPVGNISDHLADWEYMCRLVEKAVPAWTPGTKCGYQSTTFAWLLGELFQRISGISFKDYIRERILVPLGVENDFFFGVTPEVEERIVEIDATAFDTDDVFTAHFHGNKKLRRAFIPSANGISTARAAAKIFNALYGNTPLLSTGTLEEATLLCRHPEDPIVPGSWTKFGLGYALPDWENSQGDIFGHGGACGAELLYCKSRKLALCFVKNRPLPTHPVHPIRNRISDVLGLPHRFW